MTATWVAAAVGVVLVVAGLAGSRPPRSSTPAIAAAAFGALLLWIALLLAYAHVLEHAPK